MDINKGECQEGIGSVNAAISFYGDRIHGKKPHKKNSSSKELHLAQLDIGRLNETKKLAEKEKAQADSELHKARSAVRELALTLEQSSARARARKLQLQTMKNSEMNDHQYSELMHELGKLRRQLSNLKLDMASALESKAKAEEVIEASVSKARSGLICLEEISKEIEEANEEQMIVELARIEAERESKEIEAQRRVEATQFSDNMEAARKKIKELRREIDRSKEVELKLANTNSDLNVLQSEMELVRAMERNFPAKDAAADYQAELEAAKKELSNIKEEGFQFMASMDTIREELMHTKKETDQLKKQERKADSAIQHLNSKLLRAKSKLESATAADARAKAIVSNLSAALQQLKLEKEAAKKEKEKVSEETRRIRMKSLKTDSDTRSATDQLRAAMQELEAVKASEAVVLKELKDAAERTMKARASTSIRSTTITISKGEYEYLSRKASVAQMVADKKVEAAEAWLKALKAEEEEIMIKSELVEKELRELKMVEEEELRNVEKQLEEEGEEEEELAKPRNFARENGLPAGGRRGKMRRLSISAGTRQSARSPSFAMKKRRNVMPVPPARLLRNQSNGKSGGNVHVDLDV